MKPELRIRRAGRADRAAVLAFHRALYVQHRERVVADELVPLIGYKDFEQVLRDDVDSMLANREVVVLLAENAGSPLGYASGHLERDARRLLPKKGVVEDWYVDPDARGQGIGKALLSMLENVFREAGCDLIESATWPTNTGAREAHVALGFREIQVMYRKRL